MACGKPVVASDVPGLAEVVGSYGLLAVSGCEDSFVECIKSLEEPDRYAEYAHKAKIHAGDFDISRTAESYLELYKRLMKESGKAGNA